MSSPGEDWTTYAGWNLTPWALSEWVWTLARSMGDRGRREWVISVHQWAEVRRMHFVEGLGIWETARRTGMHRETVRRAARASTPPHYVRAAKGSMLDPFKPEVHRLRAGLLTLRTRLDDRHQQQPVRRWGEIFRDDVVAAAMIDRLVHHRSALHAFAPRAAA